MVDGGSNVDGSNEGLSSALVNEIGSPNKQKFLSDPLVAIPSPADLLTEFSMYDNVEEKIQNAFSQSEDSTETREVEEAQRADWDDPVASQLEELLTKNLLATFRGAVKQIVEGGYTEEAAEWAILNSGVFHGSKDAVTNVVSGALALLKRQKKIEIPRYSVFNGLQSLANYTLLEMIHVLREVRPTLTIVEAMWCLLISDLNLSHACVLEGPPSSPDREISRERSTKVEVSRTSHLGANKPNVIEQSKPRAQSSEPENPHLRNHPDVSGTSGKEASVGFQEMKGRLASMAKENIQAATQLTDDKSGVSRKWSSANSKRDMLRQKTYQFEKSYKGRVSKGALKAKVAAWGSMVFDKSGKSQSGSSSATNETYGKLTATTGSSASLVEISHNPSNMSRPASAVQVKDPVFALPAANTNSPAPPTPDPNPRPTSKMNLFAALTHFDYYDSIPYDENLKKYFPRDEKDETILMLVPHKQALENEIQGWTDWANEKVMQAARRLGKDQGELKTLRQEKEETEKFKKDRQTLEESTMKRLSEMECALSNATAQIEVASCTVLRLESENAVLNEEMEAAKLQASASAANLEQALAKELKVLKKCQLWDAEKDLLLEELKNLRRRIPEMKNQLKKAKERQDQFEALLKHEQKENTKTAKQRDTIREQKEQCDTLANEEADSIKEMAELNKHKCREAIKNLETHIAKLRLESNKLKIAALSVGYGSSSSGSENVSQFQGAELPKIGKISTVLQNKVGSGSVKPVRECVMCMNEEISVVFLPCAHQVLCRGCSDLHENQGMNDCPSCRRTIQKRIHVIYNVR